MPVITELSERSALELTFPNGLPGFKGAHRFRLEPLGDGLVPNPFGKLIAMDTVQLANGTLAETVRLVVAAPGLLWPDYTIEIDDETEALLELDNACDAAAVVVVTLNDVIESSTANLLAPIVMNTGKKLATQIVPMRMDKGGWLQLRAPLPLLSLPC